MYKGKVKLVNNEVLKFEFPKEKFNGYLEGFKKDKTIDVISFGNIHVPKNNILYVEFTQKPQD